MHRACRPAVGPSRGQRGRRGTLRRQAAASVVRALRPEQRRRPRSTASGRGRDDVQGRSAGPWHRAGDTHGRSAARTTHDVGDAVSGTAGRRRAATGPPTRADPRLHPADPVAPQRLLAARRRRRRPRRDDRVHARASSSDRPATSSSCGLAAPSRRRADAAGEHDRVVHGGRTVVHRGDGNRGGPQRRTLPCRLLRPEHNVPAAGALVGGAGLPGRVARTSPGLVAYRSRTVTDASAGGRPHPHPARTSGRVTAVVTGVVLGALAGTAAGGTGAVAAGPRWRSRWPCTPLLADRPRPAASAAAPARRPARRVGRRRSFC